MLSAFMVLMFNCTQQVVAENTSHYVDTTLYREAQIQKCASCHEDVYKNWKMGPHANAFLKLEEHDKYVDTSTRFPLEYNKNIESMMESVCISCHTGQNIYETNFKRINHASLFSILSKDSFPNAYHQAFSRDVKKRDELITGVDCITCHVQSKKVVSNFTSTSKGNGIIKSHLFENNMNCYSCHHHQVSTMQELVKNKKIPSEISCVSCHQEYMENKRGSHYFYWRNDDSTKTRPKHLDIFECVKVALIKNEAKLEFTWTNSLMPHGYSECGEAKCIVKAIYKNGKEEIIFEQLLNRKNFFDGINKMPSHFRVGTNGNEFEYNNPIIKEYLLKNKEKIERILIIGYAKPQYWSNDEEFKQVFQKEVNFSSIQ